MFNREIAETIAYDLQGTCRSLAEIAESNEVDIDELSSEEEDLLYSVVDNITFECSCCGWWCEVGDWIDVDNGENVCTQCARDEYGVEDD